jgi:hypothetical protein
VRDAVRSAAFSATTSEVSVSVPSERGGMVLCGFAGLPGLPPPLRARLLPRRGGHGGRHRRKHTPRKPHTPQPTPACLRHEGGYASVSRGGGASVLPHVEHWSSSTGTLPEVHATSHRGLWAPWWSADRRRGAVLTALMQAWAPDRLPDCRRAGPTGQPRTPSARSTGP